MHPAVCGLWQQRIYAGENKWDNLERYAQLPVHAWARFGSMFCVRAHASLELTISYCQIFIDGWCAVRCLAVLTYPTRCVARCADVDFVFGEKGFFIWQRLVKTIYAFAALSTPLFCFIFSDMDDMFLQCNKNAIYVLNTSYRYSVSIIYQ